MEHDDNQSPSTSKSLSSPLLRVRKDENETGNAPSDGIKEMDVKNRSEDNLREQLQQHQRENVEQQVEEQNEPLESSQKDDDDSSEVTQTKPTTDSLYVSSQLSNTITDDVTFSSSVSPSDELQPADDPAGVDQIKDAPQLCNNDRVEGDSLAAKGDNESTTPTAPPRPPLVVGDTKRPPPEGPPIVQPVAQAEGARWGATFSEKSDDSQKYFRRSGVQSKQAEGSKMGTRGSAMVRGSIENKAQPQGTIGIFHTMFTNIAQTITQSLPSAPQPTLRPPSTLYDYGASPRTVKDNMRHASRTRENAEMGRLNQQTKDFVASQQQQQMTLPNEDSSLLNRTDVDLASMFRGGTHTRTLSSKMMSECNSRETISEDSEEVSLKTTRISQCQFDSLERSQTSRKRRDTSMSEDDEDSLYHSKQLKLEHKVMPIRQRSPRRLLGVIENATKGPGLMSPAEELLLEREVMTNMNEAMPLSGEEQKRQMIHKRLLNPTPDIEQASQIKVSQVIGTCYSKVESGGSSTTLGSSCVDAPEFIERNLPENIPQCDKEIAAQCQTMPAKGEDVKNQFDFSKAAKENERQTLISPSSDPGTLYSNNKGKQLAEEPQSKLEHLKRHSEVMDVSMETIASSTQALTAPPSRTMSPAAMVQSPSVASPLQRVSGKSSSDFSAGPVQSFPSILNPVVGMPISTTAPRASLLPKIVSAPITRPISSPPSAPMSPAMPTSPTVADMVEGSPLFVALRSQDHQVRTQMSPISPAIVLPSPSAHIQQSPDSPAPVPAPFEVEEIPSRKSFVRKPLKHHVEASNDSLRVYETKPVQHCTSGSLSASEKPLLTTGNAMPALKSETASSPKSNAQLFKSPTIESRAPRTPSRSREVTTAFPPRICLSPKSSSQSSKRQQATREKLKLIREHEDSISAVIESLSGQPSSKGSEVTSTVEAVQDFEKSKLRHTKTNPLTAPPTSEMCIVTYVLEKTSPENLLVRCKLQTSREAEVGGLKAPTIKVLDGMMYEMYDVTKQNLLLRKITKKHLSLRGLKHNEWYELVTTVVTSHPDPSVGGVKFRWDSILGPIDQMHFVPKNSDSLKHSTSSQNLTDSARVTNRHLPIQRHTVATGISAQSPSALTSAIPPRGMMSPLYVQHHESRMQNCPPALTNAHIMAPAIGLHFPPSRPNAVMIGTSLVPTNPLMPEALHGAGPYHYYPNSGLPVMRQTSSFSHNRIDQQFPSILPIKGTTTSQFEDPRKRMDELGVTQSYTIRPQSLRPPLPGATSVMRPDLPFGRIIPTKDVKQIDDRRPPPADIIKERRDVIEFRRETGAALERTPSPQVVDTKLRPTAEKPKKSPLSQQRSRAVANLNTSVRMQQADALERRLIKQHMHHQNQPMQHRGQHMEHQEQPMEHQNQPMQHKRQHMQNQEQRVNHGIKIHLSKDKSDIIWFSSGDQLQEVAGKFLSQHKIKPIFRKKLVGRMTEILRNRTSKIETADLLDFI